MHRSLCLGCRIPCKVIPLRISIVSPHEAALRIAELLLWAGLMHGLYVHKERMSPALNESSAAALVLRMRRCDWNTRRNNLRFLHGTAIIQSTKVWHGSSYPIVCVPYSGKLSREKTFDFRGENLSRIGICLLVQCQGGPPTPNFANSHKTAKFPKVFSLESFLPCSYTVCKAAIKICN